MIITTIVPYSSLYPKLGKQLKKGLQPLYEDPGCDMTYEYISEGSVGELNNKIKAAITGGSDLIIALLSRFQRQSIAEIIERSEVPVLALDSGEFLPYAPENEYVIPHSLGLWKETFAHGLYTGGVEGRTMISLAFYEAGYQFLSSFMLGMQQRGDEDYELFVNAGNSEQSLFDLQRMKDVVERSSINYLIACVSGSELGEVMNGWNDTLPPLGLLSTFHPFKFNNERLTRAYFALPESHTPDGFNFQGDFRLEKRHYEWLGASASYIVNQAIGMPGELDDNLRKIALEFNPELESTSQFNAIVYLMEVAGKRITPIEKVNEISELLNPGVLSASADQYLSGFTEPYLCH
ncbi:hypothetical protein AB9P05_22845 [Roseivirga sp. BDSF3-8]|uniref:hypothetical protein n=1 Tax=Roseivirga sp. BDSF3-8 TaxID=3241598 RepID=UPI003531AE7C